MQTLGYFLGFAAVFGIGVGLMAHFVASYAQRSLELDGPDGRLDTSWREQQRRRSRTRRNEKNADMLLSLSNMSVTTTGIANLSPHDRLTPKSPSPMMSTAILEEVDTSDGSDY